MTGGWAAEPSGHSDNVHAGHAAAEISWHPDYRGQISDTEMAAIEIVTVTGEWL